jgi:predicted transcriptional regulator
MEPRIAALAVVLLARRGDLLTLDMRRRVFDHVVDYPGLHLRELARQVGVDPNHAGYHLRALERSGLVSSREEDGYRRYWPREEGSIGLREAVDANDKRVLALLRRPLPLHLTLVLLDRGPLSASRLADETGTARTTLNHHLARLESQGVLERRPQGRENHWAVVDAERIEGLLMRYRPPDELVQGFLEAWESLELV